MTNVIDDLPAEYREVFTDILSERAPDLLAALRTREKPTIEQQDAVMDLLSDAFTEHFGPGHEPTERGALIDDALRAFLEKWPADQLTSD